MNPATALRAEAVLFFEHGALCRTMLKVEFDALLDQVVGVADFAGQMIDAAYVTILPGLVIETVVLFRIGFDDDGYADRQWDLPLEQLLHYAEPVAITDQTNLRLSSLNHCPLPWLQTHLWEPDLQREHNVLVQIHEAISRNRLGLAFADEPSRPLSAATFAQHANSIGTAGFDTQAIEQRHQQEIHALRKAHQQALDELSEEIDRYARSLEEELTNNLVLKKQLHNQQVETKRLSPANRPHQAEPQEQAPHLGVAQAGNTTRLAALDEAFRLQEVELCYAREHRNRLEAELAKLQQERADWAGQSADGLLARLHALGVALIAYHPGAGHFNLALATIPDYLANPQAQAAQRCQVSETHYRLWLDHYQNPRCNAVQAGGKRCEQPVAPVQAPAHFTTGLSDRCPLHRHDRLRVQG